MDQNMPESYHMASDQVRRFFEEIKLAANELLQHDLGLTSRQAENEVGKLLEPAFDSALNAAMLVSWTVPVQPDWILDFAARTIWFMARSLRENDGNRPEIPSSTRSPAMYNGRVPPSPEHLARIQEKMAKQAATTPRQVEPYTQVTAAEEMMREISSESTRNVRPIQVNQAVQGSQASSSAGRGDPSSGDGTGLTARDIMREITAESDRAAEEKRAEEKRADNMAKARKAIFRLANKDSDPDPVLNYRLDVPNADPEIMAILWDAFEVAEDFPTSEGFTCTGRPWEVKIPRSSAEMFFGDGFCNKKHIHELAETPEKAEIYAHFEGEFLHIGVTNQKNTLSLLGEKWGVSIQMKSAKRAFKLLAVWARRVSLGGRQSFMNHTLSVIREEVEQYRRQR